MSQLNHTGAIVSQNTQSDHDSEQPGFAHPLSQAEIDEYLYGEDRPARERLARLREFRDELASRQAADFGGDDDPKRLLQEIDQAISRLAAADGDAADIGYDNSLPAEFDPAEHRELLSPDDDELAALEAEDEEVFSDEDVLDPGEWDEGDDFRPERGVH